MMQTENLISHPGSQTPPTKKPKTKYPKIFQCTGYGDCKMTFTRSEHLARHIRKHTGERPFSCHCSRSFSRLDNLRQHIQTVHANEQHIMHSTNPMLQGNQSLYNKPLPSVQQGIQHEQQPIQPIQPKDPHAMMVDSPPPEPAYRSKHRPSPISLGDNNLNKRQSPTSPMFQNNVQNGYYNYTLPTTPVNSTNGGIKIEPTTPKTPYGNGYTNNPNPNQNHNQNHNSHHNSLPSNASNGYYDNSNNLRSYRSVAQLSSTSTTTTNSTISRQPSLSSFSSPMYAQASNTSSWLSNVLCEPHDPNYPHNNHPEEERPHTWGPSSNNHRFSSATDDGEYSDRNSLSQLVRITEDAHISSPQPIQENGQLPSLSAIFSHQQQQQQHQHQQQQQLRQQSVSASPSSASSTSYLNGNAVNFGADNRPQLSATRSYTKNLILPRPESYPPPKGYVMTLPIADTRPPTLPPAGSEGFTASSSKPFTRFNTNLTKPLPPLPMEAQHHHQQQHQQQHEHQHQHQPSSSSSSARQSASSSSDGMDVLLQAAGV